MPFILIILLVFFAIWLRSILEVILCNINDINELKIERCSLHDWIVNERSNKLECCKCGLNGE